MHRRLIRTIRQAGCVTLLSIATLVTLASAT